MNDQTQRNRGLVARALAVAALSLGVGVQAAETRIALPEGFSLTSTEGVATHTGRHALTLSEHAKTATSRVMQVSASGSVFTDLEGLAVRVEYSADGTHVLVRQTLPPADARRPSGLERYSLIDGAGEVVWSAASKAPYRFAAGGNALYVAHYPGDSPHIRVFDLRGNLIRAVHPPRPYLDARVLDEGEEALVLFSAPRSRSADTTEGREVSLERVRLEPRMTTVWSVALDQDRLRYPELIPLDRDWVLITTQEGFVAVDRDGRAMRYGNAEYPFDAASEAKLADIRPASGIDSGSLILRGPERASSLNLATGELSEIEADPDSRFETVGYHDGRTVLVRPTEVILRPLAERPVSVPAAPGRERATPTKSSVRSRTR